MKNVIGIILIISGVILGIYVGVWICFIGGIIGLIDIVKNAINGLGIDSMQVGINVGKIVLAGFFGYVSASILFIPGMFILKK